MAFVVFAGQSNIGGPFMNASTLTQAWTPDPLTLIWNDAAGQWAQMQPGVNTGYGDRPNAWGPEVEFARDFRSQYPDEVLRLVKTAHGGTRLAPDWEQWHYDWSPKSDNELFDQATAILTRAGAALGGLRPDAIFFGQGEEDANYADTSAAYGDNLQGLFAAIREEWMGDPVGKIGFFQINVTPAFAQQVRAGQVQVDQSDANAQSIDAGQYPTYADGLHYSAAGYDTIGSEFLRLYAGWHEAPSGPAPGGGAGQDLNGSAGPDTLIGGAGDDRINGGGERDYLRGGEGDDVMSGGDAFDDMHGNQGNDTLAGGDGDDWVVGGKDSDRLTGEAGSDIVYGNLGADTCDGGAGADLIRGGQDDDVLLGQSGDDWLSGDRGADTITGGSGADIFHSFAEAGIDRVTDFSQDDGDRIQLDAGTNYTTAQSGADTVITMSGGQIVLVGVSLASLSGGWIFQG